MNNNRVSIRVWGDFACFTRPEMKVERVSYALMTPSAARGVLEAIFWEPEIYYLIDAVRVVKKGRWVSFRRNEVTKVVSLDSAATWMKQPQKFAPIQAGAGADDFTQRNMLALEDVEYIVTAEVALSGLGSAASQKLNKYVDEVERRTKQGKCFHRPSLGVREFAADFDWEADPQAALERRGREVRNDADWRQIWPQEDLGFMLYDVFDCKRRYNGFRWLSQGEMTAREAARDKGVEKLPKGQQKPARKEPLTPYEGELVKPEATFFHAHVRDAAMDCYPERITIVRKQIEGV